MIRSMTAFTRRESQGEWGTLTVELRSVNHRFLEISPRLGEELRPIEPLLRATIESRLSRGKVDCSLRLKPPGAGEGAMVLNRELVTQLASVSREVDAIFYEPAPVSSLEVMKWPGVLELPTPDLDTLRGATTTLLEEAIGEFVESREREGDRLRQLILQRCDAMAEIVPAVTARLPQVIEQSRQKLRGRLDELKGEVDENRLEQEIALLAQKLDVAEELDRLVTHVDEVRRVLELDEPVGRRLDFLMQELNREANTLGSKSADVETTRASVEMKVLIEQMREQVQNIE